MPQFSALYNVLIHTIPAGRVLKGVSQCAWYLAHESRGYELSRLRGAIAKRAQLGAQV